MDNRHNLMRQGSGLWRSLRDGDFEEEDVWDVLRERKDSISKNDKSAESSFSEKSEESSFSVPRNLPSAARMIPIATSSGSSSNSSSHGTNAVQQSAPVNIPDWSGLCKNKSNKTSSQNDDDHESDGDDYHGAVNEDDDEDYKLPPHKLIATRLARSQISSFSVFEGVGRTLKGRDLSKVRNAVLTETGFLESP
ncbi:uncharacterized protein LOC110601486 [Manihot esculenta]|uniref:Senescence regulator S40 n=1 Tax=Manihot esculenta TaxID=3983 RepID=A0A2C9UEU3_MANES|nr:uncharacterized protein LOC110601486 [Manihot esculenta]XP_043807283.1 uncharacterized protein LOC110601486 [Manihot esculenta]OAY28492.1 hypothetical protein MANES_15G071100v8 [Manihot esculenta]